MRDAWKFTSLANGELFVVWVSTGIQHMQCVVNWDLMVTPAYLQLAHHMGIAMVPFCFALVAAVARQTTSVNASSLICQQTAAQVRT